MQNSTFVPLTGTKTMPRLFVQDLPPCGTRGLPAPQPTVKKATQASAADTNPIRQSHPNWDLSLGFLSMTIVGSFVIFFLLQRFASPFSSPPPVCLWQRERFVDFCAVSQVFAT
jgi:hypothetical protein